MSPPPRWWVWKFGGSSLADSRRIVNCANLVADQLKRWQQQQQLNKEEQDDDIWGRNHLCVVVSAMGGVTNLLLEAIVCVKEQVRMFDAISQPHPAAAAAAASSRLCCDPEIENLFQTCPGAAAAKAVIQQIYTKHLRASQTLPKKTATAASDPEIDEYRDLLLEDLQRIVNALDCIGPTASLEARDYIIGFGELWNRRLFSIALKRILFANENDNKNVRLCEVESHECIVSLEASNYEANQHLKTSNLHREPRAPKFAVSSKQLHDGGSGKLDSSFLPGLCRSDLTLNCENTDPVTSGLPNGGGRAMLNSNWISGNVSSASGGGGSTAGGVSTGACAGSPRDLLNKNITDKSTTVVPPEHHHEDVLYTLESEVNTFEAVPSTPPLHGGLFENWPLPPRVQADYWPILQPNTSQCAYPGIDFQASYKSFRSHFINEIAPKLEVGDRDKKITLLWVAQGFVSRSRYNHRRPSTLGRNGSDTSAVAYGVLLRAEGCTIWSDVEGIYSADPHVCSNAVLLNSVTYEEALELASFGAKVLHPACLIPAHHIHMPILLKSTLSPEKSGTLITDAAFERVGEFGKTVTSLGNVTLITVQNRSFVPKFLSRLFTAVEDGETAPLLISQSSTSSAVTIAIAERAEDAVVGQLVRVFKYDVSRGAKIQLNIERDCSLLCVTGRGQSGYPGALAAWCDSLADLRVSIKSVSQSSTELSTCFAVKKAEERQALMALHDKILQKLCTLPAN